ncbi:hypothetical protein [Mariniblastus fucicola]|nr:hypothetical protein [Mariniblastus fucicola]
MKDFISITRIEEYPHVPNETGTIALYAKVATRFTMEVDTGKFGEILENETHPDSSS